jgi:hypothetical protein
VGYDAAALEEVVVERLDELEEGFGGGGDAAVGDGEVAEEDSVAGAGGALVFEAEVEFFVGRQEGDEDVGAFALEIADFCVEVPAAAGLRHDR